MIKIIQGWVRETRLNFNIEMLSFVLHRLTGLGLVFFIFAHLFSLSGAMLGQEVYDKTMQVYDNPFFHFGEWCLFIMCAFHAFNGIRIMLVDFFPVTAKQRILLFWTFAITGVGAGFSALFFFDTLRHMIIISGGN